MVDPIGATGANKINKTQWQKSTPAEIIAAENKGEDVPPEIVAWAQQMVAFAKIPDNVTYEKVDGDVGIDALGKLGIQEEEKPMVPEDNAVPPEDTETPDAVEDVDKSEETPPENPDDPNIFATNPENAEEDVPAEEDEESTPELSGLADTDITTDPETIRKRKEKKGLPPQ